MAAVHKLSQTTHLSPRPRRRTWPGALLGAAGLVALFGCTPTVEVRGYVPDDDLIGAITTGVDGPFEVEEKLGSPSSVATFGGTTWYYISKRTESLAFFEEEVLDQRVVAIKFDQAGLVKEIRHYGIEDGQIIEIADARTPTRGQELGFLEQLFGNIGRFNSPAAGAGGY